MDTPTPKQDGAQFLDPTTASVRTDWADLLSRSDQSTPFSTLAYAEALEDATGLGHRLAGVYEDEQLVAGILCYEKPLGPYRRVVVPPLTPYTSFLFETPPREADITRRRSALDALLELLEEHYHAMAFHLHPTLRDVRPFQWNGWNVTPRYTHRHTPLKEREKLFNLLSGSTRRLFINHASSYQLEETPHALSDALSLAEESLQRHNHDLPLPKPTLRSFLQQLLKAELVRLFISHPEEHTEPDGALWILHDQQMSCDWIAGSKRGPAMTLLLIHTLLTLQEEGYRTFDFAGANIPSIAEFKRSFGAPLVSYYRVEQHASPVLQLIHHLR